MACFYTNVKFKRNSLEYYFGSKFTDSFSLIWGFGVLGFWGFGF